MDYLNKEINIVLAYLGWFVLISMMFVLLPHFILNDDFSSERLNKLVLMANVNKVISIVDIVLIAIVFYISKTKKVKTAFFLFFLCKLFLIIANS